MIHHVVLFRWKPDTTPAQLASAEHALRGMVGRIAEIRALHYGPNLGPSQAEYPWALLVVCDDMAAVERYAAHPVHVDVVQSAIAPIREARLAIDFEVG